MEPTAIPPPVPPAGEIAVAAPPSVPVQESGAVLTRLLPVVMAIGMLAMTAVVYRSGSTVARSPMFALLPLTMLASAVAAVLAGRGRGRGNDIEDDRDNYLDYLAGLRDSVAGVAAAQRAFLRWAHPDPHALWTLAGGPRMWERRPDDPEFGRVRVGIGAAAPATRLVAPPASAAHRGDPVTESALHRFLDTHATVPEVPIAVPLLGAAPLVFDGDRDRARGLLRAMICQLAMLHGPDTVLITAACADSPRHWDWLKWLPHHRHPSDIEADTERAVLIVDDTAAALSVRRAGDAGEPRRLAVAASTLSDTGGLQARPDFLDAATAVVCAQRLAGHGTGESSRPAGWPQLLGIADIDRFDPAAAWAGPPAQRLCVPSGGGPNRHPARR